MLLLKKLNAVIWEDTELGKSQLFCPQNSSVETTEEKKEKENYELT